jgi:hypothetical protein
VARPGTFKKGNKAAVGNSGGRPTREEAAVKAEMIRVALDTLKAAMAKATETLVKAPG